MAGELGPPGVLSARFHFRYFPRLLWSRLRPKKKEEAETRFSPPFEPMLLLVLCLILAVAGMPSAIRHGSVVGWSFTILGVGGILAIVIFSVLSQLGVKPAFDGFLIWPFFFFVFFGISAGILIGKTEHSLASGLEWGALGLLLGYFFGLFAGLWLQYLGRLAALAEMASGLAIIGMVVADLVLLLGA
jgi:hypothetical protein